MIAIPGNGLTIAIHAALHLPDAVTIEWRSRVEDGYAEYRDGDFLSLLGLGEHRASLAEFWPERGPQWDALGRTSDGKVILVEAKAHVGELASTCAAGPKSRLQIEQALATTEAHLGIPPDRDWTNGFYQYANRLAHLRFMRDRGVDAHLVFVYLIGDSAMGGPDTKEGCAKVLDECHDALGLPEHTPLEGVHEVFFRPAAPNA